MALKNISIPRRLLAVWVQSGVYQANKESDAREGAALLLLRCVRCARSQHHKEYTTPTPQSSATPVHNPKGNLPRATDHS
ncbi:hypothetical protein D6792_01645 [Candidatus Parcubacteria bacterium]|nr:MAG: hypothetical protein D6792_01645 [Candidatus Parcubacteria bacterium]